MSLLAFSASLALSTLALTGCSGVATMPDTMLPGSSAQSGGLQGSVFGGHAPIVGAHVYVLQAGTTGYASASTSELTAGDGTDANGTFVLTDSSGSFNITGDYACTPRNPVYLAAVGGSSFANSTISITSATFNETGSSGKFAITFTANNALAAGQTVTFSGLSVADGYSQLNGTTQTITAATATTFSIQVTLGHNSLNGSTTGSAIFGVSTSLTNLATLGNCPSSGNFSTAGNGFIPFIYVNEVSTVATAYAFAGFGTGPFNIGASATNLLGIQNAALTAAQLYDIQGSVLSTSFDSGVESPIARATTTNGNGTVPQATLDTLGDILSTCIDSSGPASSECTTLFEFATSNGATTGVQPTDTATAMFNIAHFPAGTASPNFMSKIFSLQNGGIVPYTPNLGGQPNDFTVSISYSGGGLGASNGKSPHSVAVDASGNVYTVNFFSDLLNIFNPFGVPLSNVGFSGNGLNGPVSVAVDATSQNLWIANLGSSSVSEFTTAGAAVNTFPLGGSAQRDAAIDASGNIWVATDTPSALVELTSGGVVTRTVTDNLQGPGCVAAEPGIAGNIWTTDETENDVTVSTSAGATTRFGAGAITDPVGCAIDANGFVWVANSNGSLSALTNGGKKEGNNLGNSPFKSGNANPLDGIAIDGADQLWVTNGTSDTIYEWSSAGNGSALISPANGYTAKPATSPDGIAIDPSGNVWYNSSSSDVLYELVGAGTPVVTPISFAVANAELGTQP